MWCERVCMCLYWNCRKITTATAKLKIIKWNYQSILRIGREIESEKDVCMCIDVHSPCIGDVIVIFVVVVVVVVVAIIIIIIGVEPTHRRQIKKWYRVNVTLLFGWMTYRVFFDFILLLFCWLLPPLHTALSLGTGKRETSHSSSLYIRTNDFVSFPSVLLFLSTYYLLAAISMCKNVPSKIEWIGRCENRVRKTMRATEIDTLTILTYLQYISWMLLPLLLFGSPFVYLRRVRMCVRRNCEMYNVRPVRPCFRYIAFVYVAVVDAA